MTYPDSAMVARLPRSVPMLAWLAVFVASAALTGCGGSDAGQFRSEFHDVSESFDGKTANVRTALQRALGNGDAMALSQGFAHLATVSDEMTSQIDMVEVPDELRPAHERLIGTNNEISKIARRLSADLRAHPEDFPELWQKMVSEVAPLQARADAAIAELNG